MSIKYFHAPMKLNRAGMLNNVEIFSLLLK
nr:MAG TPA: hypothetical protein [Caudoviricetes sp.]